MRASSHLAPTAPTPNFKMPKVALGVVLCLAVGFVGNLASGDGVSNWFLTRAVQKPPWEPPAWVFAPVWTVLYILMGIAAGLVWSRGFAGTKEKVALGLFATQLALNVAWCWAFFGMRSPTYGYAVIFVLWFVVIATVWSFGKIRKTAGLLLLPYFGWITFASTLNYWILQKNVITPQVERMKKDPKNAGYFDDDKRPKDKSIFAEPEQPAE